MERGLNIPCDYCKAIGLSIAKTNPDQRRFDYQRTDSYPDFPAITLSASNGCAFCGLLRHALQSKYSSEEIARIESHYSEEIRKSWPTSWDKQVKLSSYDFETEGDSTIRTAAQEKHLQLDEHTQRGATKLFLRFGPFPPRINQSSSSLYFNIYADPGNQSSLNVVHATQFW